MRSFVSAKAIPCVFVALAVLGVLRAHGDNGELVWVGAPGGVTYNEGVEAMAVDSSGNVYITGYFQGDIDMDPGPGTATLTSAGSGDIFILKLDPDGNYLWAHGFGNTSNDVGKGVAVDASGNVYVAGFFRNTVDFDPGAGVVSLTSAGNDDAFVLKLDAAGDFAWAMRLGALGNDQSNGIAVDAASNVYTTGVFESTVDFDPGAGTASATTTGLGDVFVFKLDAAGNYIWHRTMGGTDIDAGSDTTVDNLGNIYVTGFFRGTADFDPGLGTNNLTSNGSEDVFITKLDSDGTFVWARSVGGTASDQGSDIAVDLDGNVLTTGTFFSPTIDLDPGSGTSSFSNVGLTDSFLQKLDSSGDFVWAYAIGGPSNDSCIGIAVDSAGAVYSTGRYSGTVDFAPGAEVHELTANSVDYYVQKYDAAGNLIWVRGLGAGGVDVSNCIAVDNEGAVYTAGSFTLTVDFDPGLGVNEITSASGRNLFVQKLLPDLTEPTVTSITPDVSSQTNADTINFTVVFSEGVVNFDDVSDLAIVLAGVSYSAVTITGGPSTYTVEMTGISGDGFMTVAVDTGSDVTDFVSLALSSSVLCALSIDNTPPTFNNLAVSPGVGSVGTLVEITFDTPPPVLDDDPEVTVNGHAATLVTQAGLTYTYQYTVLASDPVGFANVEVSGLDAAGNVGYTSSNSLLEILALPPSVPVVAWPAAVLLLAVATRALRRRE